MVSVTATELKNHLGQYLETAQREPVVVEKSGRRNAVVLSMTLYEQLREIEDQLWDLRAQLAEREGFASAEAVARVFGVSR